MTTDTQTEDTNATNDNSVEETKVTRESLVEAFSEASKAYDTADKEFIAGRNNSDMDVDDLMALGGKRKQALATKERAERAIDRYDEDAKFEAVVGITTNLKGMVENFINANADEIKAHGLKGLNVSIDFTPETGTTINVTRPGTRTVSANGTGGARSKSSFDGMTGSEFIKSRGTDGGWASDVIDKRSADKNNVMYYARMLAKKLNVAEVKS